MGLDLDVKISSTMRLELLQLQDHMLEQHETLPSVAIKNWAEIYKKKAEARSMSINSSSHGNESSSDEELTPKKQKLTKIFLKSKARTGKSPKKRLPTFPKLEDKRKIRCCLCFSPIVLNIAQHLIKVHNILDPDKRRRLCVVSRLGENKRKGKRPCPICDKLVGRVSQHLQRYHKLTKNSNDYRRFTGKGHSFEGVLAEFKVFMQGSSGGGNKDSSINKVMNDVRNTFIHANGVTFDATTLEPIIIDKTKKDNTIYNIINSMKHFLRFAEINKDMFELDLPKLAELQARIKNWAKTYKKKAEARSMSINSSSHQMLLNSKEKVQYLRSPFAMSCERMLREEAQTSAPADPSRGDIIGHLMLRLQLHNMQRPKAIARLRWQDFDCASHQAKSHVVKSHDHKTAEAMGSASLAFPEELHALVAAFRRVMPIEGEFVFTMSGKALSTSSATKLMQLAWAKGGLKSHFSSTLWRKSVVTAEMQNSLDGMNLEVSRRDANISMLTNEKARVSSELHATEDNFRREKMLLTEQVVELKKMKEVADREIALKDNEIVSLRQSLERTSTELRHERHSRNLIQAQFDQRVTQHNEVSALLEEKRNECLRKQSEMHYLEEKFNTSTMAIQDKISRELKDEIRSLRQQLRSTELQATQDRIMKDKMVENVSKLTHENASLHSTMLDLTKQVDHERLMLDEKDSRAATHTSQITELRGSEQVLTLELNKFKELLDYERKKYHELEAQMLKAQDGLSSTQFHNRSVQSRLDEVEARFSRADTDNAQLRKDKQILVEHIAQLQKKLDLREAEILRMEAHMHTLQNDVSGLKTEIDKSKSMQSRHWDKLSRKADSLRINS